MLHSIRAAGVILAAVAILAAPAYGYLAIALHLIGTWR